MKEEASRELLEKVIKITKKAGAAALVFYGQPLKIKDKGHGSPVTQADLAANKIIVSELRKFGWPILSEEGIDDQNRSTAGLVWIVDPLDGTKDFIGQTGEFTIMIGLVKKQKNNSYRPLLGVIYRPIKDTVYYARTGKGAWRRQGEGREHKLRVLPDDRGQDLVLLTSRFHTTETEKQISKKMGIGKTVIYGSSLKICLIADKKGHLNFNTAPRTWEWDVCASDVILHEAGGRFTDSKGRLFNYNKKDPRNRNGYVATNGPVHSRVIKNIKELSGTKIQTPS